VISCAAVLVVTALGIFFGSDLFHSYSSPRSPMFLNSASGEAGAPIVGSPSLAGAPSVLASRSKQGSSSGKTVEVPKFDANEKEILDFRRKLSEGYRPVNPDASSQRPASEYFTIECDGRLSPLQAALDEVYVPWTDRSHEIVEMPAATNLSEWREKALAISPIAELVLYAPDLPRTEGNARMLGSRLILEGTKEAENYARSQGWTPLQLLDNGNSILVDVGDPLKALSVLRSEDIAKSFKVYGDFRRVPFRRQSTAQPSATLPVSRKAPWPPSSSPSLPYMATKRFSSIPSDPYFNKQWHCLNSLDSASSVSGVDVNVTPAWGSVTGAGIVVGIVDDAVQIDHPDIKINAATGLHHNWNTGDATDPSPKSPTDQHGTQVAGLVAAKGNNGLGVTGVAPSAQIAGLRLIGGPLTDANQIEMFNWKLSEIDIKNNSWGLDPDDGVSHIVLPTPVANAMGAATRNGRNGKGTVIIWANGNGNVDGVREYWYPTFTWDCSQWDGQANSIYVISVAAIGRTGVTTTYSEYGANIAISAPSDMDGSGTEGLITTTINSGYSLNSPFGGTSGATPLVSGVAALMLASNPDLGWRDVKEILMRSARVVDNADAGWVKNSAGFHFHPLYGAGLVDATEAVRLASEWNNLDTTMRDISIENKALNLLPKDVDPEGVTQEFKFSEDFRMESLALKWSARGYAVHDLVFYITSPSGTTVRMNAVRRTDYSTLEYKDVKFTTPFFWGERSKGTWKVKVTDEYLFGAQKTVSLLGLTLYGSSSPVAPPNDYFEKATVIDGATQSISTSNLGATREQGELRHAAQQGGGSIWYKVQVRTSGYLTIDTVGSAIDTLLSLYTGTSVTGLTDVIGNDDISTTVKQSRISRFAVQPGEIYMLAVDGKNRARGSIRLNFNLEAGALFDNFADAKPVNANSWSDSRSNATYSAESGEPSHAGLGAASKSVWYLWTPQVTGTATVTTSGSALDTRLGVYLGTRLSSLRQVTSNDNDAGRTSSKVTFGVRAGENYAIALDGKNGASGNFTISGIIGSATVPVTPPPANDLFTGPIAISGAPLSIRASNVNATRQTGEPAGTTSVWYEWTAPQTGIVTVTTDGSLFDTTLGAYTGSTVSSVVPLPSYPNTLVTAENDNAVPGERWSRVRFTAANGAKYLIRVNGARGATGRYDLKISY